MDYITEEHPMKNASDFMNKNWSSQEIMHKLYDTTMKLQDSRGLLKISLMENTMIKDKLKKIRNNYSTLQQNLQAIDPTTPIPRYKWDARMGRAPS